MNWILGLLLFSCETIDTEQEETTTPFRTACMGGGTPEQQITAKALLEYIGETKCYAAWKKLSVTTVIDLESHSPPISDLSVLKGLTQIESLFIGDSLIPDIEMIADFVNLKDLRINHTEISDLKPLSALTKLERLNIDQTEVKDLTPIESLSTLTKLSIRNTKVSSLSSIQKLTGLKYLDISKTLVADLSGIEILNALQILSLRETQTQDIRPLAQLSQLKYLDIFGTAVDSVSPLSTLSNLEVLDISFTQVSDLQPLEPLLALNAFRAEFTPVSNSACPETPAVVHAGCPQMTPSDSPFLLDCESPDSSPLFTTVSIENLKASLQIQDCQKLHQHLKSQSRLSIKDADIYDVILLSEFTNLKEIELKQEAVHPGFCPKESENTAIAGFCAQLPDSLEPNAEISADCTENIENQNAASPAYTALIDILSAEDCSDLSTKLPLIDSLEFELLELTDISPLRFATNLRELYIGENNIRDVSSLASLSKLKILWLDNNQITDLSPLSKGSYLWLGLGENRISDLSPLENQTELVHLWLGGNQIEDITPLSNLKALRKLHLAKNKISRINALTSLPELKKLYLADNQITDPTALLQMPNLQLLNVGLDDQESPLEASRWLLTNNPIDASFCQTKNKPYLFEFHCAVHAQVPN